MTTVNKQKFVSDFFDIKDFEVKKLAEINDYWKKFRDFWESIKEREARFITEKQAKWLSDVEAELADHWRNKWMEEEGAEQTEF